MLTQLGASLVTLHPDGGIVPYLAESWTMSEDGLTWEFTLREGVKFHDGTPLTAADYAWTLERAVSPEINSVGAGPLLGPIESAEAPDDLTLVLHLKMPFYPLLLALTNVAYAQPLSRAAVEAGGELYGFQPMGVGPYKFKEWTTGDKIVVERNPDFNWAPEFAHEGPAYLDSIEFRIIPEEATILAGLEAGEVDYYGPVQSRDLPRLEEHVNAFEGIVQGWRPSFIYNVEREPFNDIRVRQAFNYAVDREAMMMLLSEGKGVPVHGPLSPSQDGYWPGIEELGYDYDLEKAQALLVEAGYTLNADGMFEKDGEPLKFRIDALPSDFWTKVSELTQDMYRQAGIDSEIVLTEPGLLIGDLIGGNFDFTPMGRTHPGADMLYDSFHSSMIDGGGNWNRVNDPVLDDLLDKTRSTMDPDQRQEYVNQVQQYVVEQAYMVPVYALVEYHVVNKRVQGVMFSKSENAVLLYDAHIAK